MWLCTQHGFYSIVRKRPGEYHIRARRRLDLENLLTLCRADWPIHRSVQADYRFRIVCGLPEVGRVLTALGEALDYSNFKSRIHSLPDQASKSSAYAELWAHLFDLQEP